MLSRRVLLGSAVAAPFVVRSGLLMPISTAPFVQLIAPPTRWVLYYRLDPQGNLAMVSAEELGTCDAWLKVTPIA